jgi:hypothetical protein
MFPISTMCEALEVSRAAFYAWQTHPESERHKEDKRLLPEIKISFESSLFERGLSIARGQLFPLAGRSIEGAKILSIALKRR